MRTKSVNFDCPQNLGVSPVVLPMRCLRKSSGPLGAMPPAFWSARGLLPFSPAGLPAPITFLGSTRRRKAPENGSKLPAGKRRQAIRTRAPSSRTTPPGGRPGITNP